MLSFIKKQLNNLFNDIHEYQNKNKNVEISSLIKEKIKVVNLMLNNLLNDAGGDKEKSPVYLSRLFANIDDLIFKKDFDYTDLISVKSLINQGVEYLESYD